MSQHKDLDGERLSLVPQRPFELHRGVPDVVAAMHKRALEGGAASMRWLPQHGVRHEAFAFAYGTGLPKEMNVLSDARGRALGSSGQMVVLHGTLVIHVSGHAPAGILDRIVAFVEAELAARGQPSTENAALFADLRAACQSAHQALVHTPSRMSAPIPFALAQGLQLSRGDLDALLTQHRDRSVVRQADRALQRWFAASTTYEVRVVMPNGNVLERHSIARNNPEHIELVTTIPLAIPLMGGVTLLQAWPAGSGGARSYREAREMNIHAGTSRFSLPAQVQLAKRYEALYPDVRWGTPDELDDVSARGISPSPHPYQDF